MVHQPSSSPMLEDRVLIHSLTATLIPWTTLDSIPPCQASLHVCGNSAQISGDQVIATLFPSLLAGHFLQ